jgi:hypothetical protein
MVVAVSMAACGSDSSVAPSGPPAPTVLTTPAGSYDISTINAKSLPVAIFSDTGGYTFEVTSGTLILTADGKYSTKLGMRQTIAGKVDQFTDSTGGTWVLSGTTVTFTNSQDQSTDKADWSNTGKLTFVEIEGKATNTYVYAIKK